MKSYAPIIALVTAVFAQSAFAEGGADIRDDAMRQATERVMSQYKADHVKDAQVATPDVSQNSPQKG
ncbi:hypothetical protein IFT48_02720 [Pseudomonas fluorescens]|uniref:co-regulatory protein PtrA N-terminal domain-containing protein n=1 Tax=Pseudomonas TaxID=286 RepID=UPI001783C6D8|nr:MULTISPECIES: co-regulatory protein PtrA N-terminal domain-containing protein [Pseudomonas]MBD8088879.1 hypothetical protein [Pseudomonas fluorescens]MBD8681658.1 hypothetical protein [Pseudomonas sp. CFBP 13719]